MARATETSSPGTQNGAAMLDRTNRTFICSVLFLDIVEYSRKPVSEQILLKERFNALIAESIRDIAPNDRIILDTGDGAAINFLGDPEDALFVAMNLREGFKRPLPGGLVLETRIGLNLGPVRLVKDLNSQPNIIGDGINVAQRVMSFADPGQVLVSRSYFEVVSHISEGYAQLFSYRGSRTDKHVREHEIYEVGMKVPEHIVTKSGSFRPQAASNDTAPRSGHDPERTLAPVTHAGPWWRNARAAYVAALVSVLALAAAVFISDHRADVTATAESEPAPKVATAAPAAQTPIKPVVRKMVELDELLAPPPSVEPAPDAKEPRAGHKRTTNAASHEVARISSRPEAPLPTAVPQTQPVPAAQAEAASAEKAVIALAVTPWGEVYVNGAKLGVSPPVNVVEVNAGKAEIELRNPGFPSYTETVELAPGQHIRVKHKF
jgi:hypothetical protein